jgi:hypothetical protein
MTTVTALRARQGWFTLVELTWFIAVLATGIAMAAALAHALELPNKIVMNAADYFAAQQSYRGWDRLAFLLVLEAVGIIALTATHRHERPIVWRLVVSWVTLALAQVLFWFFTFPANTATDNWTLAPANWEALRSQWEYSHLGGAIFQVLTFSFLLLALQRRSSIRA